MSKSLPLVWRGCLGLILTILAGVASARDYSIIDLGHLPEAGDASWAHAINDHGEIVGVCGSIGTVRSTPYIWRDGHMTNLTDDQPYPGSAILFDINNSGFAVGSVSPHAGEARAFLWSSAGGFEMQDLTEGPSSNVALEINDAGIAVGTSTDAMGRERAVRWDGSGIHELGVLPGETESRATGINNANQIVGKSGDRSFIWEDGVMIELPDLPGGEDHANANAINIHGTVAGSARNENGALPVLWTSRAEPMILEGIAGYGGKTLAYAGDINDRGEVVGVDFISDPTPQPFYWSPHGGIQDFHSLLGESGDGWDFFTARAINNHGHIVGSGRNPDGEIRGFLIIPEPAAVTLMVPLALATLGRRGALLTRRST